MKKIEKIMVPVAFSPYSQGIVDYALMLAGSLDVRQLIFVSVINQRDVDAVETITAFGYDVDSSEYVEEIKRQRAEALDKLLENSDFPADRMKLIITVGKPARKILKHALREEVDMIVMGVKGRSEIAHAFTGSVAEKLFRRSPITIVSYRDEEIAARLRKRIHD